MNKIFKYLNQILILLLIFIIRLYQLMISPLIGNNCRYLPTCSEYTIKAIKLNGLKKGITMSVKRILSCHPFGKHGYDPVVKKNRFN